LLFYLLIKLSLSSPIHRKNKRGQIISQIKKTTTTREKGYAQQQQTCFDRVTESKEIYFLFVSYIYILICRFC
jgi:hypothetical protein